MASYCWCPRAPWARSVTAESINRSVRLVPPPSACPDTIGAGATGDWQESMHPELQRLEQRYLGLVAELQAGNITEDDALRVLGGLTAIDGEGALWSIDPFTGEFARALPGATPVPVDPSRFAPAQLPVVPIRVPAHGTPLNEVSDYLPPSLQPLPPTPAKERASAALGAGLSGTVKALGPVGGFLRRHLRSILVPSLLLIVALVLVSRTSSSPESTDVAATQDTMPLVTTPAPTIIIPGAPTPETTNAPVPVPAAPATPDAAALDALLVLFTSGDPAALAAGLPVDAAARVALLPVLGAPRAGFQLSWGEPVKNKDTVIVPLRIGDPVKPARVVKIRLRYQAAAWVIVSVVK